jgi:AraC-like DNA-binding protein
VERVVLSVSSPWILLIVQALKERGIDADALLRDARLRAEQLLDHDSRLPLAGVSRLWALSVAATQDPCFGLEVGRLWHPTTFQALGYAALASRTLHEALARLVRYCAAVSNGAQLELIEGPEVTLRIDSVVSYDSTATASAVQAASGAIVKLGEVCGRALHLSAVTFQQSDHGFRPRFEDYFKCPVTFNAQANTVVFSAQELDAELSTGNPDLVQGNLRLVADYLARTSAGELSARMRPQLMRSLPSGEVNELDVAHLLHMSLRSMQRKLKEEGTSFRGLLDDTRRELAEGYLRNGLGQSQIAFLLGFADASSLARALRRWDRLASSDPQLRH